MDKDFKPFEKGFSKKDLNRLLDLIRRTRTLPIGPGWSETPDGMVHNIRSAVSVAVNNDRWTLRTVSAVEDEESVEMIRPGVVRYGSAVNGSDDFTITNVASTFTVADGDYVVLQFTLSTRELLLTTVSTWDDFPSPFTIVVASGEPSMTVATFPLWKIVTTATVTDRTTIGIGPNLKGIRMVADSDFQMRETLHETSTGLVTVVADLFPAAFASIG